MFRHRNYIYGKQDLVVPAHLNFSQYILQQLWQYRDNVALINGATHETITYGEMLQQAINFAVSLARMGIRKGDVIALVAENRQDYWSALIGAISAGAAVTTMSTTYEKGELVHTMNISKPKFIICSPFVYKNHEKTLRTIKFLQHVILFGNEKLDNVILYNELAVNIKNIIYEEFQPIEVQGQTDTLFIIYSSGTTGLPKGVMLTHLNVLICCFFPFSHDPTKKTLSISPWYHAMGLVGSLTGMSTGRTGVYLPKFDVNLYLKTIERYQIAQLSVVPPVLVACCKSTGQYDLSSVRLIYSGAAPLHKETSLAVYEKFPNLKALLQGYGASETTLAVLRFPFDAVEAGRKKQGSVGNVVPGCTLKVVDLETRQALGPNKLGELCVKGTVLMKGYIGVEKGEDFDEEGFYKTGDVGYYDEDEYFYIADRLKELIKYKGFQVPPAELEALLLTHEAVKDVGVIGIPHKSGGEVPLAFVVKQPGKEVSENELKEFVAERLSNPKHLRGGVRFVNEIPKSPSGKIIRKDLKKMAKASKSKL